MENNKPYSYLMYKSSLVGPHGSSIVIQLLLETHWAGSWYKTNQNNALSILQAHFGVGTSFLKLLTRLIQIGFVQKSWIPIGFLEWSGLQPSALELVTFSRFKKEILNNNKISMEWMYIMKTYWEWPYFRLLFFILQSSHDANISSFLKHNSLVASWLPGQWL